MASYYVQRDAQSNIVGLFARAQSGLPVEILSDTDPGVAAYLDIGTKNVIPFAIFIGRWADAEYQLLLQKRAQVIAAASTTNMFLVKEWDQVMSSGAVNLNSAAALTFKADIVSAGILTQARADVIFS